MERFSRVVMDGKQVVQKLYMRSFKEAASESADLVKAMDVTPVKAGRKPRE